MFTVQGPYFVDMVSKYWRKSKELCGSPLEKETWSIERCVQALSVMSNAKNKNKQRRIYMIVSN